MDAQRDWTGYAASDIETGGQLVGHAASDIETGHAASDIETGHAASDIETGLAPELHPIDHRARVVDPDLAAHAADPVVDGSLTGRFFIVRTSSGRFYACIHADSELGHLQVCIHLHPLAAESLLSTVPAAPSPAATVGWARTGWMSPCTTGAAGDPWADVLATATRLDCLTPGNIRDFQVAYVAWAASAGEPSIAVTSVMDRPTTVALGHIFARAAAPRTGYALDHAPGSLEHDASPIVRNLGRVADHVSQSLARAAELHGLDPETHASARIVARAHLGDHKAQAFIDSALQQAGRPGLHHKHHHGFLHGLGSGIGHAIHDAAHVADSLAKGSEFVLRHVDMPEILANAIPIPAVRHVAQSVIGMVDPNQKLAQAIDAVRRGDLKALRAMADQELSEMQGVVSLVPGIGSGISAAMGTAEALLHGGHPIEIALRAAYGAIPIPIGIRSVTDTVLDTVLGFLAHPHSLTDAALAIARDRIPSGLPRDVFDTLVHVVAKHQPIAKAAGQLGEHYVKTYTEGLDPAIAHGLAHVVPQEIATVLHRLPPAATVYATIHPGLKESARIAEDLRSGRPRIGPPSGQIAPPTPATVHATATGARWGGGYGGGHYYGGHRRRHHHHRYPQQQQPEGYGSNGDEATGWSPFGGLGHLARDVAIAAAPGVALPFAAAEDVLRHHRHRRPPPYAPPGAPWRLRPWRAGPQAPAYAPQPAYPWHRRQYPYPPQAPAAPYVPPPQAPAAPYIPPPPPQAPTDTAPAAPTSSAPDVDQSAAASAPAAAPAPAADEQGPLATVAPEDAGEVADANATVAAASDQGAPVAADQGAPADQGATAADQGAPAPADTTASGRGWGHYHHHDDPYAGAEYAPPPEGDPSVVWQYRTAGEFDVGDPETIVAAGAIDNPETVGWRGRGARSMRYRPRGFYGAGPGSLGGFGHPYGAPPYAPPDADGAEAGDLEETTGWRGGGRGGRYRARGLYGAGPGGLAGFGYPYAPPPPPYYPPPDVGDGDEDTGRGFGGGRGARGYGYRPRGLYGAGPGGLGGFGYPYGPPAYDPEDSDDETTGAAADAVSTAAHSAAQDAAAAAHPEAAHPAVQQTVNAAARGAAAAVSALPPNTPPSVVHATATNGAERAIASSPVVDHPAVRAAVPAAAAAAQGTGPVSAAAHDAAQSAASAAHPDGDHPDIAPTVNAAARGAAAAVSALPPNTPPSLVHATATQGAEQAVASSPVADHPAVRAAVPAAAAAATNAAATAAPAAAPAARAAAPATSSAAPAIAAATIAAEAAHPEASHPDVAATVNAAARGASAAIAALPPGTPPNVLHATATRGAERAIATSALVAHPAVRAAVPVAAAVASRTVPSFARPGLAPTYAPRPFAAPAPTYAPAAPAPAWEATQQWQPSWGARPAWFGAPQWRGEWGAQPLWWGAAAWQPSWGAQPSWWRPRTRMATWAEQQQAMPNLAAATVTPPQAYPYAYDQGDGYDYDDQGDGDGNGDGDQDTDTAGAIDMDNPETVGWHPYGYGHERYLEHHFDPYAQSYAPPVYEQPVYPPEYIPPPPGRY